jgi:CyaY protein
MPMDESEFARIAEQVLQQIERRIEASGIDADCELKGTGVLELEFPGGGRIIVNSQSAMQEIWVAAKSGGYHFRREGTRWINTRDGSELFAALSAYVSQQSGAVVSLTEGD